MATLLTDKKINSLQPEQWATESHGRGAGQLQARGLKNRRVAYYFRYTGAQQKQIRIPLGSELTLAQARHKAAALSRQHQEGYCIESVHSAHAAHQQARLSRQKRMGASINNGVQLQAATQAPSHTFGTLLLTYVEDLNRRGCSSEREVRNAFKKHIEHTWPELWHTPATLITTDHILQIVRTLAEQQKLRAADKLRCYIRAAYAAAIQARQHIDGLPAFIALKINTNPARDIPPIRQSSQTKDRVLSIKELRTYWQYISQIEDVTGALLRFHLLTGGQRIQQLARATIQDYDHDSQTITLKDPKGRRAQPRLHTLPLLPQAQQAMQEMLGGSHTSITNATSLINGTHNTSTTYLWSVTGGQYGACYSTASKALKQVIESINQKIAAQAISRDKGRESHEEREALLTDFTLGDIRRTVETRLAAAGVPRETRAQLQSHGLSGVQTRHYDRHDYLQEKKEALQTLYALLQYQGQPQKPQEEALEPECTSSEPTETSAETMLETAVEIVPNTPSDVQPNPEQSTNPNTNKRIIPVVIRKRMGVIRKSRESP